MCRRGISRIAELTNTRIETGSVDFHKDGSVIIRNLRVSERDNQSAESPILEAETVRARFAMGGLLVLRPRLEQIDIEDFTFNAQYDSDTDRWNLSSLQIRTPERGFVRIPKVRLETGTLQYCKRSNGQVKFRACLPVSAGFKLNQDGQSGYDFEIATAAGAGRSGRSRLTGTWKPGHVGMAGEISAVDIPELQMAWTMDSFEGQLEYESDKTYSLKLGIKELRSARSPNLDRFALAGPALVEKSVPFAALRTFFNRYRPSGRIDIDLDLSGNLNRLGNSMLSGRLRCKDVAMCHDEFRYPIEHLTGLVDFTPNKVTFDDVRGRHGSVRLLFNGWAGDFGPDWKYDVRVRSDNMALDDDLYGAMSAEHKEFWSMLSPSGLVAVDYRLSQTSRAGETTSLAVELLGGDALYRGFPYPLENLTGRLLFERDDIEFSNIESRVGDRIIRVNGRVRPVDPGSPRGDFSIDVNNIPLDSTLEAALPARYRDLYSRSGLAGLADGHIEVSNEAPTSDIPAFTAALSFKNVSFKSEQLPLPVTDIGATAVFTRDSMDFKSLTGRYGRGRLSLEGQVWPDGKPDRMDYRLSLNLDQAQLDDDLLTLLPPQLEKTVSQLQPQGKVNIRADLDRTKLRDDIDYNIIVDFLGDSVTFKQLPYPLKDVTGRLSITPEVINLDNITASPGDNVWIKADTSAIRLSGRINMNDGDFSSAVLQLATKDIFFDDRLAQVLPDTIRSFYGALLPVGRFDLDLSEIEVRRQADGKNHIDLGGKVTFKKCGFGISGARMKWDAALDAKALYKTGEGLLDCRASLGASRVEVQDKSFTDLSADINYDGIAHSWRATNLTASCYGGRLAGRFEFRTPVGGPPDYTLQVGFADVDLGRFLSEPNIEGAPRQSHGAGTMDGSLSVSARLGDSSSRIGTCRLAISDMQVGKLSPLAKLLQVLRLTEPTDYAFNRMFVDSYIRHDELSVRKLDLAGRGLAFYGAGSVDLKSRDVDMTLIARGRRLATADPSVLQSLTEGIGQAVVRLEVTGSFYDPQVKTRAFPLISGSLDILGTKPADTD